VEHEDGRRGGGALRWAGEKSHLVWMSHLVAFGCIEMAARVGFWVRYAPARDVRQIGTWLRFAELSSAVGRLGRWVCFSPALGFWGSAWVGFIELGAHGERGGVGWSRLEIMAHLPFFVDEYCSRNGRLEQ
jgi:hypothetical protein